MVGPISNWSQHPFNFFFNYIFDYIFSGYNGIFSIKWSMENQGKGTLIFIDYVIIHEILNLRSRGKKLVEVLCLNLMLKYQNLKCAQCLQYFRIWVTLGVNSPTLVRLNHQKIFKSKEKSWLKMLGKIVLNICWR